MSQSAKAVKFPVACANSGCAQPLCGPVNHCPYCGAAVQRTAPTLRVVSPAPVPEPASAPAKAPVSQPVPASPPAAPAVAAPVVAPASSPAPSPEPEAARPKRRISKAGLGLVVLLALGAYGLQQLGSKHDQQQVEQALAAGKACLGKKDYRCAIDNADLALQKISAEPRALSLKQQAQAGLARLQKSEDDKQARLQAEAQRKAAAEQARQDQARARAEQQELEARRRSEEQDLRAQQLREQRAEEQRQQELRAQLQQQQQQQQRAREQRAQERPAQQPRRSQESGNYVAPQNVLNRPGSINLPSSGSSTDDIIRQGQQLQQFQRQQQQQRQPQGQQQDRDVIRSIIQ